jgi:hypothetical protein
MMAEKISDAMLGLPPLPAEPQRFYDPVDWQTRQR